MSRRRRTQTGHGGPAGGAAEAFRPGAAGLALALLLAGDVDEALSQAEQAAARSPDDKINRALLTLADDVKAGRRPQPTTLAELEA